MVNGLGSGPLCQAAEGGTPRGVESAGGVYLPGGLAVRGGACTPETPGRGWEPQGVLTSPVEYLSYAHLPDEETEVRRVGVPCSG